MDNTTKAGIMADYLKNKVLASVDERLGVLSKKIAEQIAETNTLKAEYDELQAVKDEANTYISKVQPPVTPPDKKI